MSTSPSEPGWPGPLRGAAAVALGLHGLVHLLGFSSMWRLQEYRDIPARTFIANGAIDVGDGGVRIVGLLWIVAAAALVVAAVLVWRSSDRAMPAVVMATTFSLAICIVGLPAAIIGVWIDLAILALLLVRSGRRRATREVAR